ncbi:phosphate starvation-inducible PhoH-like protein [Kibdelosporangium phytohabitans]|uniref:PhoH-like protein n=1 Tax=Kibdelosporangium phytohabitans TaxID=860235 RepID=A0A0N9HVI6_9PSEU|nr:phosphate starvation-inducible protein PhoH [Kibdelosporangium phytohabitans]MBE1471522.1 phosphate starvation-inducible PhoH-like protein [Kibdelosporangium phytohabitans]
MDPSASAAKPDQPGHPAQSRFSVPDAALLSLLGSRDENLRVVEELIAADVHVRGNEVTLSGTPADVAFGERVFAELSTLAGSGQPLTADAVRRSIAMLSAGTAESPAEVLSLDILSRRGRTIRPKTLNQKHYVDAIDKHTVVFGIGPAGTGKTYLAMAKAVQALQAKQVNRIILTRPAVEAGERLGYLPGTLYEKIDPYLRPLYDALHDMVDPESIPRLTQAGTIEVAPLAYMRGRAQPVSTKVLTPDGFRPIGELSVGDLVIGSNGEPTPVLGVYPQGEKDIYRVTAQDGASVLCCGEHLWTVRTASDRRRNKPWRVLQTKEMIGRLRAAHARRYELPVLSSPVCHPEQNVPMDPYALGLLLGDGCLTGSATPSFATDDPELAEALESALPDTTVRRKGDQEHVLNRVREPGDVITLENPVTRALRSLNLLGTRSHAKFIPDVYLQNTTDVRLGVLQGLLDSDGGPVTQLDRTCRIQYVTTSPALRDGVTQLVRSLGGVAYTRVRPAKGRQPGRANGRDVAYRQDAHIVDLRLPTGIEPFRLARKREKYHAAGGGGRPMRHIDSIEPAGRAKAVCIQVAAADSLYVTEDYLLTHNTLNDAFIILDEAQNTTPEQMKMFLTRLGFSSKIVVTGDVTQVDLPGGQRSGLKVVRDILEGVDDVHFSTLTSADVVRHKLVADIVDAYERWQVDEDKTEIRKPRTGSDHRRGR